MSRHDYCSRCIAPQGAVDRRRGEKSIKGPRPSDVEIVAVQTYHMRGAKLQIDGSSVRRSHWESLCRGKGATSPQLMQCTWCGEDQNKPWRSERGCGRDLQGPAARARHKVWHTRQLRLVTGVRLYEPFSRCRVCPLCTKRCFRSAGTERQSATSVDVRIGFVRRTHVCAADKGTGRQSYATCRRKR